MNSTLSLGAATTIFRIEYATGAIGAPLLVGLWLFMPNNTLSSLLKTRLAQGFFMSS